MSVRAHILLPDDLDATIRWHTATTGEARSALIVRALRDVLARERSGLTDVQRARIADSVAAHIRSGAAEID